MNKDNLIKFALVYYSFFILVTLVHYTEPKFEAYETDIFANEHSDTTEKVKILATKEN